MYLLHCLLHFPDILFSLIFNSSPSLLLYIHFHLAIASLLLSFALPSLPHAYREDMKDVASLVVFASKERVGYLRRNVRGDRRQVREGEGRGAR